MPDNRIEPLTVATAETDKRLAPVASPTGIAVMQQWAVRAGFVIVGLASIPLTLVASGVTLPAWLVAACTTIVSVGAMLGIASPGVRKPPE